MQEMRGICRQKNKYNIINIMLYLPKNHTLYYHRIRHFSTIKNGNKRVVYAPETRFVYIFRMEFVSVILILS